MDSQSIQSFAHSVIRSFIISLHYYIHSFPSNSESQVTRTQPQLRCVSSLSPPRKMLHPSLRLSFPLFRRSGGWVVWWFGVRPSVSQSVGWVEICFIV